MKNKKNSALHKSFNNVAKDTKQFFKTKQKEPLIKSRHTAIAARDRYNFLGELCVVFLCFTFTYFFQTHSESPGKIVDKKQSRESTLTI